MDFNNREKLIKKEITNLLIKFHKGESLGLTITAFMNMVNEIRALDEHKISYVLKGLRLPKMEGNPMLAEEKAYISGYNEAADQNNFAVNLAINAFKKLNDEEK